LLHPIRCADLDEKSARSEIGFVEHPEVLQELGGGALVPRQREAHEAEMRVRRQAPITVGIVAADVQIGRDGAANARAGQVAQGRRAIEPAHVVGATDKCRPSAADQPAAQGFDCANKRLAGADHR
jgi:hypothetical protein